MVRNDIGGALTDIVNRVVGDPVTIFEHVLGLGPVRNETLLPAWVALQETDLQ